MRSSPLILGLATLAGCTGEVHAPAGPAHLRLVEEHRLGTLEDGPTGFGDIRSVLVDRRGQLWVLDFAAQQLQVFDSAGTFVRTVGRKGQGPGEFVYADGMTEIDGTIWVQDPQNGRLTGFDEDGNFVSQVAAPANGYGFVWSGGADSTGHLWEDFIAPDSAGRFGRRFRRYDPGLARADTLDTASCLPPNGSTQPARIRGPRGNASIPFQPGPLAAIDFNGRLACLPWSANYQGAMLDLISGDTLVRFRHSASMIPVPAAERDSAIARLTAFATKIGADFAPSAVPTEQPALQRMFFDNRGRLWVQRVTVQGGFEYDRFGLDGVLEATIESPFKPSYFAPHFRGERIYFIVAGPDDVPQVIRMRLAPVTVGPREPALGFTGSAATPDRLRSNDLPPSMP